MRDDGELVLSEPKYHIHGYGPTLDDAKVDFLQVLGDSLDLLQEDQENLDPYLYEQLRYLQSVIAPA